MGTFVSFVFLINLINSLLAHPKIDLDYTKCISENQALFVNGIENLVKSSDPLEVDMIDVNLPELKYKLMNAKLRGLKDCAVVKLRINKEKLTFEYNLECTKIEANAQYTLQGRVADICVEGDGDVTVTTGFYILMFHGYFEIIVDEDKVEHAHIKSYHLDFEARESLIFNFTNLYGGDKKKSDALHKFINENWQFMDKAVRSAVLTDFMNVFIDHLNDFLKVIPIKKVFPTACGIQT